MDRIPVFLQKPDTSTLPVKAIIDHGPKGQARALWWPPRAVDAGVSSDPTHVILFIPGNPGLPGFYIDFFSIIRNDLKSSTVAIMAHSHLGHDPEVPVTDKSLISLDAQVAAAIATYDLVRAAYPPNVSILLMGHSIGTWICMKVMDARPDAVLATLLLAPTISHLKNSSRGHYMKYLVHPITHPTIMLFSPIIRPVSNALLSTLYRHYPEHQLRALRSLLTSWRSTQAMMIMAHHEMEAVAELDVESLKRHQHRIRFLYAKNDPWVPDTTLAEVLVHLDPDVAPTQVRTLDVPHDFCINHNRQTADVCIAFLDEVIPEANQTESPKATESA